MDHLDTELLSAYIDHELSAADMAVVEQHLAACDACRAEYEELRGLSILVRELPVYEPKRVIDVSGHPRGGSDTLAKIIAFSKPLAIAAVVLLVAFAGFQLLTDDEPDDSGDQISFSAVQPTEPGTDAARETSEDQAQDAPGAAAPSDEEAREAPGDVSITDEPVEEAFADGAPSDQQAQESEMDSAATESESFAEAPPMGAMGALPQGPAGTAIAAEPAPTTTPTLAPTPASEGGGVGDAWLPVAIVAVAIVAIAGAAGWYRFVRPKRRGT